MHSLRQRLARKNMVQEVLRRMSLQTLGGQAGRVASTDQVTLRGSVLKSDTHNNLDMIFIGEMFDSHASWAKFFKEHNIDSQRNIYMLHPRNFGNSDRHESLDVEEMSNDVVRFMDAQGIKQATLAGHGFGGKLALSVGCYHSTRVTGVCVLDSGPLDHRHYEPHRELVDYLTNLQQINMDQDIKAIQEEVKDIVECPKWRQIFLNNLKEHNKKVEWDFDMDLLAENMAFNKEESLGVWNSRRGMFSGRVCFIFPDQSRWVHLNTNTLAMLKTCARCLGFGRDVFAIQGDDSPLNHWVYDFPQLASPVASKFSNFLLNYDGVPLLMQNRQEIREQSSFLGNYTHRNLKFPGQ